MSGPGARTVRVPLGDRAYEVVIGAGLLDGLPDLLGRALSGLPRFVFAVVDENAVAHADRSLNGLVSFGGVASCALSLHASEVEKSLETAKRVLVAMAEQRVERSDVVLAIGGGIVGDVAGFAAAVYRRGVRVVQCPTTLLAMVDASVGGKTGVNLAVERDLQTHLEKNLVGAFHQPALVIADISTLSTLPDREFRAGLAECVKHGLIGGCIGDEGHLGWIEGAMGAIRARDPGVLVELIERSVACKAAVVAGDERESAEEGAGRPSRALLNLGHTFAHAIETLPGLSPTGGSDDAPLLHGEAVALGLVAAASTSATMGRCGRDLVDEVRRVLHECGLPVGVAGLPSTERLLSLMGADKKVQGGRVRLVLPTDERRAEVVSDPPEAAVRAGWDSIRTG